ncbi:MAG: DUF6948 domain-containing protein [Shewanella sp.]
MSIFKDFIGERVLIRSYGSGVHFGVLNNVENNQGRANVVLSNSRRIHQWEGAASLSQISQTGIKSGRIAMEIHLICISDVIEIIPITQIAFENLLSHSTWKI